MSEENGRKRIKVTLTDAAPVKIYEDEWPLIACATGDNYGRGDPQRHEQALSQDECDKYTLRVRRHADGRVLIYGTLETGYNGDTDAEDWKGGELLPLHLALDSNDLTYHVPGQSLIAAIRRVGQCLPDRIVRECIADLPAEDI